MQKNRFVDFFGIFKNFGKFPDIVPVKRPITGKAQIFKKITAVNNMLDQVFHSGHPVVQRLPEFWNMVEDCFDISLGTQVSRRCPDMRQIARDGPHVSGDRHLVIIQNDNKVPVQPPCIVQPLDRQARLSARRPRSRQQHALLPFEAPLPSQIRALPK